MRTSRRIGVVGAVLAAAGLVPAAMASACIALVALTVSPQSVQAGGTVAVTGKDFAPGAVIEIHLDSPTGRLLATQPPHNNSVMMNTWTLNVPIPADVAKGQHFLVATEDYHNMNSGVPARATIYVDQAVGAPAAVTRSAAVPVSKGMSTASLVLIGLCVAAVALFVAALLSIPASRRSPQPEARPARTS